MAFDVEASIADAIRASGSTLEIFGASYTLDDPSAASAVAEYYRNAVMLHFNERVGAPDAALWQEFADQARDQLERHPYLDGGVLDALRLTIDNL